MHRSGQRLSKRLLVGIVLGVALAMPLGALAVAPAVVLQQGRVFNTQRLLIAVGTLVRFTNADDFPHQINISGPGMLYDSELQDPRQTIDIPFPNQGTFEVRCGIHPRMRMTIQVGPAT